MIRVSPPATMGGSARRAVSALSRQLPGNAILASDSGLAANAARPAW
jgi:hypothetical protein